MVIYNDVISNADSNHNIILNVIDRRLNDGKVDIYNHNELIYSGFLDGSKFNTSIDSIKDKITTLKIFITKNNNFQYIPLTTLRLHTDEPYIICDIDFTLSYTNVFLYITRNILSIKSLPDASSVLTELSKKYTLIYLTGRIINHTKMTKLWLKKNNFPDGPIISRHTESTFDLMRYKSKSIASVSVISKKGIGIGDLNSDIKAYLTNDLVAIKIKNPIIRVKQHEEYEKRQNFYEAESWKAIKKIFNENNFYGV